MIFDPFEDRESRDVRNTLGQAFIRALRQGSVAPFEQALSGLAGTAGGVPPHVKAYMDSRRKRLDTVLERMAGHENVPRAGTPDDRVVSGLLWANQLFFEFHEWQEALWQQSRDASRKARQALVLAAIVFEHQTYGRSGPAASLAHRTIRMIRQTGSAMPGWVDPARLIRSLERLDPAGAIRVVASEN